MNIRRIKIREYSFNASIYSFSWIHSLGMIKFLKESILLHIYSKFQNRYGCIWMINMSAAVNFVEFKPQIIKIHFNILMSCKKDSSINLKSNMKKAN